MNNSRPELPCPGFYRHYKGRYYQLLAVVHHSEEDSLYALYRALYGDFGLWVRPLPMFCENVSIDGEPVARFSFVGTEPPADLALPPALNGQLLWPGFPVA